MAEAPITGLVLAGGAARRLQAAHPGADKGLLPLSGRPLIAWVIDNLAPQVQDLVISANRHLDDYRQLVPFSSSLFSTSTAVTFSSLPLTVLFPKLAFAVSNA